MLPHRGGPRAPKAKDSSTSLRQVLVNPLATFSGLATIRRPASRLGRPPEPSTLLSPGASIASSPVAHGRLAANSAGARQPPARQLDEGSGCFSGVSSF